MKKPERLIEGANSPLLTLQKKNIKTGRTFASLGFIIKDLGGGEYIAVATAHGFYVPNRDDKYRFEFLRQISLKDNRNMTLVGEPYIQEEQDVALFKVYLNPKYKITPLTLSEEEFHIPIGCKLHIFQAVKSSNDFSPMTIMKFQKIRQPDERIFYNNPTGNNIGVKFKRLPSDESFGGESFMARKIFISSTQGSSGSPIVTDNLNVIGMNMGTQLVDGVTNNIGHSLCVTSMSILELLDKCNF